MQRFRLLICNESFKPCHISRRISIRIQKSNLKAMREKGVLDRAESGQLPSPWGEKSVAGSGVPPPRPPWGEGSSPARPRCPSPTHHRPASARPNFLRCFLGSCFPPAKPTKRNPWTCQSLQVDSGAQVLTLPAESTWVMECCSKRN